MALRIFVGTYERVLLGLDASWTAEDTLDLKLSIAYATHIGCIKALAVGGAYLASGSTDEVIKLYDVKKKRELGAMHSHAGTITALRFYRGAYMFSASDDGDIAIYRTKDWEKLKVMKGHRGSIADLAIHPSGKLALSIGAQDDTLRMWDLLKCRIAYTTKIRTKKEAQQVVKRGYRASAERVVWNAQGDRYAVLFNDMIRVHKVGATGHEHCLCAGNVRQRFLCATFYEQLEDPGRGYLLTGSEDGLVRVWDLKETAVMEPVMEWQAHSSRIRDVLVTMDAEKQRALLVSISTDGFVKVWDLYSSKWKQALEEASAVQSGTKRTPLDLEPLAQHNCETRLTCLALQNEKLQKLAQMEGGMSPEVTPQENQDSEEQRKPSKKARFRIDQTLGPTK